MIENLPKLLSLTRASKARHSLYTLLIRCHVTPACRGSEGIKRISNEQVHVHVGAEPKKGQANDAVCRVLAKVLNVPKSDISIIGGKQRTKVGVVAGIDLGNETEESFLKRIRDRLDECSQK